MSGSGEARRLASNCSNHTHTHMSKAVCMHVFPSARAALHVPACMHASARMCKRLHARAVSNAGTWASIHTAALTPVEVGLRHTLSTLCSRPWLDASPGQRHKVAATELLNDAALCCLR